MSQNSTKNCLEHELNPKQIEVLELLLKGMTITDAAKATEVARETVHRWKSTNRYFISALNEGKRELREIMNVRLFKLAHCAVEQVEKKVSDPYLGDEMSYQILKDMGFLNGKQPTIETADSDLPEETTNEKEDLGVPLPNNKK